jgi:hypothetical protein
VIYRRTSGLDNENVPAPNVFTDFNHYLTVAEGLNYSLALRDLKVLADLGSQLRIGITTKQFKSIQYHRQKPNNPHGAERQAQSEKYFL